MYRNRQAWHDARNICALEACQCDNGPIISAHSAAHVNTADGKHNRLQPDLTEFFPLFGAGPRQTIDGKFSYLIKINGRQCVQGSRMGVGDSGERAWGWVVRGGRADMNFIITRRA